MRCRTGNILFIPRKIFPSIIFALVGHPVREKMVITPHPAAVVRQTLSATFDHHNHYRRRPHSHYELITHHDGVKAKRNWTLTFTIWQMGNQ